MLPLLLGWSVASEGAASAVLFSHGKPVAFLSHAEKPRKIELSHPPRSGTRERSEPALLD